MEAMGSFIENAGLLSSVLAVAVWWWWCTCLEKLRSVRLMGLRWVVISHQMMSPSLERSLTCDSATSTCYFESSILTARWGFAPWDAAV
jgi:hypothetical protein